MRDIMVFRLGAVAAMLAGCGTNAVDTFQAPEQEIARLEERLELRCDREARDYVFCMSEHGYVHVYLGKPLSGAGTVVQAVMLDAKSSPSLQADAAAMYGFSLEEVQAVREGKAPVRRGNFELFREDRWGEVNIRYVGA